MQIVAVPLFNEAMRAQGYAFRYLKENLLLGSTQLTNIMDGGSLCEPLEVLNRVGLEAFTLGQPVFIPIEEIHLYGDVRRQCPTVPPTSIIFVIEQPLKDTARSLPAMSVLMAQGYRFAINYKIDLQNQECPVLKASSFIFLSQRDENIENSRKSLFVVQRFYRNLAPIAAHVYTQEMLSNLRGKGYIAYESRFYSDDDAAHNDIEPMKATAIRLMNSVQNSDFEFSEVAKIVGGDPALTASLFKIVNTLMKRSRDKINSIQHAVAILGEREIRKWITTAMTKSLGADRPTELVRISLIRAKFLEGLAPSFGLQNVSQELFLLGLFSAIDHILNVSMETALKQVSVSQEIEKALLRDTGTLEPVLRFAKNYEKANWHLISREMMVRSMSMESLSSAYQASLEWYRDLMYDDTAATQGK